MLLLFLLQLSQHAFLLLPDSLGSLFSLLGLFNHFLLLLFVKGLVLLVILLSDSILESRHDAKPTFFNFISFIQISKHVFARDHRGLN